MTVPATPWGTCVVVIVYTNLIWPTPTLRAIAGADRRLQGQSPVSLGADCAYCHNVQGQGAAGVRTDLANVIAKQRSKDWIMSSIRIPSVSAGISCPNIQYGRGIQVLSAYIRRWTLRIMA